MDCVFQYCVSCGSLGRGCPSFLNSHPPTLMYTMCFVAVTEGGNWDQSVPAKYYYYYCLPSNGDDEGCSIERGLPMWESVREADEELFSSTLQYIARGFNSIRNHQTKQWKGRTEQDSMEIAFSSSSSTPSIDWIGTVMSSEIDGTRTEMDQSLSLLQSSSSSSTGHLAKTGAGRGGNKISITESEFTPLLLRNNIHTPPQRV